MKNQEADGYLNADVVLAVFAKQPQLGKVKTRLQPSLGELGALDIHKQLIRYVYCNLASAALCRQEFWVAHDSQQPLDELFTSLCAPSNTHYQYGADLGKRMAHTAKHALERASHVILVGADCPSVDGDYVRQAIKQLQEGASVVLGPAEDGGYVLLGLSQIPDGLFIGVDWGSDKVLAQTRNNLLAAGVDWVELEPKWDVDRPEDLVRLGELSPAFPWTSR